MLRNTVFISLEHSVRCCEYSWYLRVKKQFHPEVKEEGKKQERGVKEQLEKNWIQQTERLTRENTN